MTNIERFDGTTFYGVVPGTRLTFALDLHHVTIVEREVDDGRVLVIDPDDCVLM